MSGLRMLRHPESMGPSLLVDHSLNVYGGEVEVCIVCVIGCGGAS